MTFGHMKNTKLPQIIWAISVVLFIASVFIFAQSLPNRVATHFDATGHPNGWMTRAQYISFFILSGVVFSGFVIGVCYMIRFFPSSTLNVPNKEYWRLPENYSVACDILFSKSFWLAAMGPVWLACLNYSLVQANLTSPPLLNWAAAWILSVFFIAGTLVWSIFLIMPFMKRTKAGQSDPVSPRGAGH